MISSLRSILSISFLHQRSFITFKSISLPFFHKEQRFCFVNELYPSQFSDIEYEYVTLSLLWQHITFGCRIWVAYISSVHKFRFLEPCRRLCLDFVVSIYKNSNSKPNAIWVEVIKGNHKQNDITLMLSHNQMENILCTFSQLLCEWHRHQQHRHLHRCNLLWPPIQKKMVRRQIQRLKMSQPCNCFNFLLQLKMTLDLAFGYICFNKNQMSQLCCSAVFQMDCDYFIKSGKPAYYRRN